MMVRNYIDGLGYLMVLVIGTIISRLFDLKDKLENFIESLKHIRRMMAQVTPFEDAPKVGSRQWKAYKAQVCEEALKMKSKLEKLGEQFGEVMFVLKQIFEVDDKEYFSESGTVQQSKSNSYSIKEENISKVKTLLEEKGLTIDDYINQKTSWGVTAKLRGMLNSESELASLVEVKQSSSVTVKSSRK